MTKKLEQTFEAEWKITQDELIEIAESGSPIKCSNTIRMVSCKPANFYSSDTICISTLPGVHYGILVLPKAVITMKETKETFTDVFSVMLVMGMRYEDVVHAKWKFNLSNFETSQCEYSFDRTVAFGDEIFGTYKDIVWKNTRKFFVDGVLTVKVHGVFSMELPEEDCIEYELVKFPIAMTWDIPVQDLKELKSDDEVSTKMIQMTTIPGCWYKMSYDRKNRGQFCVSTHIENSFKAFISVYMKITFLNSSQSYINIRSANYWVHSYPFFCDIDEILDPANKYIKNGFFTIKVDGMVTEFLPTDFPRNIMTEHPFSISDTFTEDDLRKAETDGRACTSKKRFLPGIPHLVYWIWITYVHGKTVVYFKMEDWNNTEVDFLITVEVKTADFKKQTTILMTDFGTVTCCNQTDFFDPRTKFLVEGKMKVDIKGVFYWYKPIDPPVSLSLAYEGFDALFDSKPKLSQKLLDDHSRTLDAIMSGQNPEDVKATFDDFDFAQSAVRCFHDKNYLPSLSVKEILQLLDFARRYKAKNLMTKLKNYLIGNLNVLNITELANYSEVNDYSKLHQGCLKFLLNVLQNGIAIASFTDLKGTIKDEVARTAMKKYH